MLHLPFPLLFCFPIPSFPPIFTSQNDKCSQELLMLLMCVHEASGILGRNWSQHVLCAYSLNCVWLFVTLWTVACQAPLSVGFSRQESWSGLPCPPPGNLPNPGLEPRSPALQADSLPSEWATREADHSMAGVNWNTHNFVPPPNLELKPIPFPPTRGVRRSLSLSSSLWVHHDCPLGPSVAKSTSQAGPMSETVFPATSQGPLAMLSCC